jgi:hypothetical protein
VKVKFEIDLNDSKTQLYSAKLIILYDVSNATFLVENLEQALDLL